MYQVHLLPFVPGTDDINCTWYKNNLLNIHIPPPKTPPSQSTKPNQINHNHPNRKPKRHSFKRRSPKEILLQISIRKQQISSPLQPLLVHQDQQRPGRKGQKNSRTNRKRTASRYYRKGNSKRTNHQHFYESQYVSTCYNKKILVQIKETIIKPQ